MRFLTLLLFLLPLTAATAQPSNPFVGLSDTARILGMDSLAVKANSILKPGQLTMLVFWNSMMRPALSELDSLHKVYPEWQKKYGVEIIGVACEFPKYLDNLQKTLAKRSWKFRLYRDQRIGYRGAFDINTFPVTYFFDKQGKVVHRTTGFEAADIPKFEAKLQELMKQ